MPTSSVSVVMFLRRSLSAVVSLWFRLFRRCSVVRVLIFLALLLTAVQICVFLVSNLQKRRNAVNERNAYDVQRYFQMIKDIESSQVMDSSGQYTIVRNIIKSELSASAESGFSSSDTTISLVSQCSVNHLNQVLELSLSWQGPISVAVFVSGSDLTSAISTIIKLVECNAEMFANISLHLVYSLMKPGQKISLDLYSFGDRTFCDGFNQQQKVSSAGNYAQKNVAYPNNLLRNVALENADGKYIFVIDIDMLPSHGLYSKLTNFIQNFSLYTNNDKCFAFVVPTFEIRSTENIPKTKFDVLDCWQKKLLRPFYAELCWKCQKHTNYSAWRDIPSSDSLRVGYSVTWKDPWEPFYVLPKSAPKYDERFKQYGFNRISQSCELHVAGFQFLVLDNAFLIHRGFKTAQDFHAHKDIEQNSNRLLFRKFKQELKAKYQDSNRRCY